MPYYDPDQAAQALRDSAKRSLEAAKAMPDLDETSLLFMQAQSDLMEVAAQALRWHVEAKNNRVPETIRGEAFGVALGAIMARFVRNESTYTGTSVLLAFERAFQDSMGDAQAVRGGVVDRFNLKPAPSGRA